MHPHSQNATSAKPGTHPQPDIHHVMYRLDQLAGETHKLREEMQAGFAQVHGEFLAIRKDHESFKKELAEQRLEYTKEFSQCRAEFKADLNASRAEFKDGLAASRAEFRDELHAMRDKFCKDFDVMLDRSRIDMKEFVASVVATVDDRIKMSGQASDLRLIKWCARAAISSSAAAGSLA
ncbi:hypothetical protein PV762_18360 [Mitsuaria sp. CC2]|uniref:hypothetical protein n=1 Tax=Mitsuaria sp. CC2 TaxID=3029186 RepID=UPI003B8AE3FB